MPFTAATHGSLGLLKHFLCGGREASVRWLCASQSGRDLTAQLVWRILLDYGQSRCNGQGYAVLRHNPCYKPAV